MSTRRDLWGRWLVGSVLALALLVGSLAPGHAAETNYCAEGQSPTFVMGFAQLKGWMGDRAGDPVECEHYDSQGNAFQRTTRGTMYYDKATNRTSFIPGGLVAAGAARLPTTAEIIDRFSVPALRAESFGRVGRIETERRLGATAAFTRYQISYPSDGLTIGGFMNVPTGRGPFPVLIVNHGYMPTRSYQTLTYTTKFADVLASAGFLVIHPNYRNHNGSDYGDNPYRVGYARDILNLIPMAQRLPDADGGKVGLWGHSMGGGISLRVLTVSDQVAAAVLYAAVSGNEALNWEHWGGGWARRYGSAYNVVSNPELNEAISSISYLDNIDAAVAIHHGTADSQVPYGWSTDLAERLTAAGVGYDYYSYRGANHNFNGATYTLFNQRTIDFFREHLD